MSKLVVFLFSWCSWSSFLAATPRLLRNAVLTCGISCTAGQICKDKKMLCTPEPAKGKDDECCKSYSCTQGEGKIVNTKGKKNGVGILLSTAPLLLLLCALQLA